MEIHIDGLNEVMQEIEALTTERAEKIARGVAKAGEEVCGEAKANAPVDTGRLRDSITAKAEGNTAIIGTNVEYAMYQELGTYKMHAQPYLVPALLNKAEKARQIIEDELLS